jgi:hypothetical protein
MKTNKLLAWVCLISLFISIEAKSESGLVLWNKLDSDLEVANSEIGQNGYIVGSNYAFEPAMHGNGYVRKATGANYIRFPHNTIANLNQRGSIELWVNPKAPKPIPYEYGIYGFVGTPYHWAFGVPRSENISLVWGDTVSGTGIIGKLNFSGITTSTPDEPSQFIATVGVPFHVAMSWDIEGIEGTTDKIRVYRDGEVVGSTTQSWNLDGGKKDDLILGYGPDSGGYDKFIVDNLIIWDYAKTDFSDRFNEDPTGKKFEEFTIDNTKIHFRTSDTEVKDRVIVNGSIVLNYNTDGIDPMTQDLKVNIGSYTLTIPKGSFFGIPVGTGYHYIYYSMINNAHVLVHLREDEQDTYTFFVQITHIDLSGTANPVVISLSIGNDSGETEQRLKGLLH